MTMLTKIGNSQGIRIPKPLIAQANLQNHQIELEVVENGLLLKPIKNQREDWEEDIKQVLQKNSHLKLKDEAITDEFLDDSDLEVFQW
jgi:antitoxin MazE